MTLLQHYYLSLMLIALSSILIGIWAIFQKGNKRTTRFFLLYSTMIAGWGFCQAHVGITEDPEKSLWWARMMFYPVTAAPILLTYFFAATLKEKPHKSSVLGWPLLLVFVPFLHSDAFIHAGGPVGFLRAFPRAGPLFVPFIIIWVSWVIYALSILARKALDRNHPRQKQIPFLLLWFAFGYIAGSINYLYLYGICLPPLQPFASYGVPIAWMILAYGMFAYRIFDTRVVIRKSLVYSLLITILTIGYFGLVYTIEKLFQSVFGYQSFPLSLISFALMALTFQPLKGVIQRIVDWLIFRAPQEELIRRIERLEREARDTEKLRAVATMAAGLCHELRNPLQIIQTHAEFLPDRYDDPAFREQCKEALRTETIRINTLLKELMEFAKPKPAKMRPIEPHPLLDSTLNLLNADFLKHEIQLEKKYLADGTRILADPDRIRQVVLNLALNAMEAIGHSGKITVTTRQDGVWFILEVTDTGPGIDPKILSKLFQPFSTTKENGNGLGLSVAHSIIESHRGRIFAESKPSEGTCFTVKLPLD